MSRTIVTALLIVRFSLPLSAEVLPKLDTYALQDAVRLGLGRVERVEEFLRPYKQTLAEDGKTPFVSTVEVLTPFRVVVDRAKVSQGSYDIGKARKEYTRDDDSLTFRATIVMPLGYAYISKTVFGTDWVIRAQQNGKLLKFLDSDHRLLTFDDAVVGAVISVSHDMDGVDLTAPVTVVIISPDGNRQELTFNLADLR